jgi:monoamine oxidase
VKGGNDHITRVIAKELGDGIILNPPVVAIDHHGSQVVVAVKDRREFCGDQVVSTIPFSVMSEIKVTPQWSPAK